MRYRGLAADITIQIWNAAENFASYGPRKLHRLRDHDLAAHRNRLC